MTDKRGDNTDVYAFARLTSDEQIERLGRMETREEAYAFVNSLAKATLYEAARRATYALTTGPLRQRWDKPGPEATKTLEDELTEKLTASFPAKTEAFDGPPDPRFPLTGIGHDMSRAASSGPTPEGYADLAAVLKLALRQSSEGKGKDRHASDGKPFDRQPIMEIARMTQGIDFHVGQVMKKVQEASTMVARGQHDRARAELLGAIVYAAAAFKRAGELKDRASSSASG
ncbi:MAG: hypothetical protein WCY29_05855 [Novosphingobium sp.]